MSDDAPGLDALGLSRPGVILVRAGIVAWTGIALAVLLAGALRVAQAMLLPVVALALAALVVIILDPGVRRLERRGLPRWAGVTLLYLAILIPAGFGMWWFVRVAVDQLRALARNLPQIGAGLGDAAHRVWSWLGDVGVSLPAEDPVAWLADQEEELLGWAVGALEALGRIGGLLVAWVIGTVLAFYLLVALPRIRIFARSLVPADRRASVVEGVGMVGGTVSAFIRGQLIIALIVGILSTVGLLVLGVPYAALIGGLAGATNLIPFFGPIVGSALGVVVAWATDGPILALWVLVLFVVIQQFESYVLSPLILGATVRLRPIAVVLGILTGYAALGILGMLLAVPVMASIKGLWQRFGPKDPSPAPADG